MFMLVILFTVVVLESVFAWGHKPAHEVDPRTYASWQLPSSRWRHEHEEELSRKRRVSGRDDSDLAQDWSNRNIARQWSEVLLSSIRV
jgi:hypothetical protein